MTYTERIDCFWGKIEASLTAEQAVQMRRLFESNDEGIIHVSSDGIRYIDEQGLNNFMRECTEELNLLWTTDSGRVIELWQN